MFKILFYDLETTGLDPEENRITEIAMEYENLKTCKKDTFHEFIKYDEYPDGYDEVAKITGLTPEILAEKGDTEENVYNKVIEYLSSKVDRYDRNDKIITGGYNIAKFDDPFFRAFFLRFGNKYYGSFISFLKLDLLTLFALADIYEVVPKLVNNKLETYKEYFKMDAKSHSAEDDIRITKEIFQRLLNEIAAKVKDVDK